MANEVRWFDDWYALETVARGVTAIGEPHYHQVNWNYLIEGETSALLFDTGPGVRDIVPVVKSLTSKPLVAMPSHMHYDHTGNLHRFPHVAVADLPVLRGCAAGDVLMASDDLFLGHLENMLWRPITVNEWQPMGHVIDLGGLSLEVVHTPGHSPDSVSLLNGGQNYLLAADFIYPGPLYAQVPGANLQDYLTTAQRLLEVLNPETRIFSAHGEENQRAPVMARSDIADLANVLQSLKSSGKTPESTTINAKMTLLANNAAFAPWQNI